jgi:pimeloyl-ACP methyl ester carboxylesterase
MRVFLLHGLGADSRAFQRFERMLHDDWSIESLDLLGHGDAPKPITGYSQADHANYIAGVITSRLGLANPTEAIADPPVVVGHSYGAAVGTTLAATYPNLVRSLVLLDPIVDPRARRQSRRDEQQARDEHQPTHTLRADPLAAAMHPAHVEAAAADSMTSPERASGTQQMIEARRSGSMAETVHRLFARESEALRNWVISTWERMAVGVVDELDPDWMQYAPSVVCPVTIIHGQPELGGGGDEAASFFANPEVISIDGAGHYLHATHARQTAGAVIEAVNRSTAT